MENELCQAGELLAQRFDLGIEDIQSDILEVKESCQLMAGTLQSIDKSMAHHLGEHKGSEKCGAAAGRKYGIIYGFTGAIVGSVIAAVAVYEAVSSIVP